MLCVESFYNSMKEQHIIVDWGNSFSKREMLEYIGEYGLEFKEVIHVPKLKKKSKTMTKFYNKPIALYPAGIKIDDERGATDFTIYRVNAEVCYDYRHTGHPRLVNINLNDFKWVLRKKAKSRIHVTDNIQETKDNLTALGLYEKHYNRREFKDISEVFDVLNTLEDFKYVVMRSFEGISDAITIDEHFCVDLLVTDYYLAKCALDASSVICSGAKLEDGGWRVLNSVLIDGVEVWFNLRYLGDNYYDTKLEHRMLNDRIAHKNFYVPDKETHLYTLIYHAIIHKDLGKRSSKEIFRECGVKARVDALHGILDGYMKENKFNYVRPTDKSVGLK